MKKFRQTDIKKHLYLRAAINAAVRRFFNENGYLEVETPIRIPAPAPEAHIDAVPSEEWYLHTSPELCMKRLLAAGYTRIFQICKCFRRGERGKRHLPEFTLLEWYTAATDYRQMMDETESLIRYVVAESGLNDKMCYHGHKIDFKNSFLRMTVREAFERYASVSLAKSLEEDVFEEILTAEIEPFLGNEKPVFLYDYPKEMAALARLKADDPSVAERFELYICGIEICNAFSELTDEAEQQKRFEEDNRTRRNMGKKAYPEPRPFLESLPQMPEASGNALGIDRLVMVLSGQEEIDQVSSFTPEEL